MAICKTFDEQTSANADVARRDSLGSPLRAATGLKWPRFADQRYAHERAMLMDLASARCGHGPESYPTGAAFCAGIETTTRRIAAWARHLNGQVF